MDKIIEIIKALDENEKKEAIKEFDSDILFQELWMRSIEERKALADIETTLKNHKQGSSRKDYECN